MFVAVNCQDTYIAAIVFATLPSVRTRVLVLGRVLDWLVAILLGGLGSSLSLTSPMACLVAYAMTLLAALQCCLIARALALSCCLGWLVAHMLGGWIRPSSSPRP